MARPLTTGEEFRISAQNRYSAIIEAIFHAKFQQGQRQVDFEREDISMYASRLNIELPRNLGDVIYSFRYRTQLPDSIRNTAPDKETWIIRGAGRSKYRFELVSDIPLTPNPNLSVTKVPDSTPGIIAKYAFNDEQAVLARVRYNRLIDIFLGIACYSLQNHLRTTVHELGQVETDEVYVGVDKSGSHYVIPVQAKGGNDRLSRVQIEQDIALCAAQLPDLICRPIGAQILRENVIALLEFEEDGDDIQIVSEKQYDLVPPEAITREDLFRYKERLSDGAGS